MLKHTCLLTAACFAAASALCPASAEACGGCFIPPSTENTVVTGHRMALSLSPTQSVLWDQILYAGDPADFSWVLPVKKGARIEAANDAFFDVLDAATGVTVVSPNEGCSFGGGSSGCSSDSAAPTAGALDFGAKEGTGGVTVVHKGTVGPYETVTLSATDPAALNDWLEQHGYDVPKDIQPIIDAYVEEGFDFIAIRLIPGKDVAAMQPVRVITPGASPKLPLRMVAAGVGAQVGVILFVISEGRQQAVDYRNNTIPAELVTWDFKPDRSDYTDLRAGVLAGNGGKTWLTTYAKRGTLLSSVMDPIGFNTLTYNTGTQQATTIAEAYVYQGQSNSAGTDTSCLSAFNAYATSSQLVVNPCDENGDNCEQVSAGQLDARQFACGDLDDIAVALTGLHPKDVFITRLEANLPTTALSDDLELEPSDSQSQVENRYVAALKVNACWDQQTSSLVPVPRNNPAGPRELMLLGLALAGIALAGRRRRISPSTA